MNERMNVGLFGLGTWGKLYWAGPLLQMADEGRIRLTLVDKPDQAPWWVRTNRGDFIEIRTSDLEKHDEGDEPVNPKLPDLTSRITGEQLRYVSATTPEELRDLDAAIVVTGAWDHLTTIRSILSNCPNLRYLICEKPCGDSLLQFSEVLALCQDADVQLVVTDHYLLRPNVQTWLADPSIQEDLCTTSNIEAFMLEEKSEGPPDQDANLDMLIHPLNLLHTLLPNSRLDPEKICMGRGLQKPHAAITYCLVEGELISRQGTIPCQIEVGKQLSNQKTLLFDTLSSRMILDLGEGFPFMKGVWAYRGLLDAVLLHQVTDESLRRFGGIPGPSMLRVWAEMERIRDNVTTIRRYHLGTSPDCRQRSALDIDSEDPVLRKLFERATSAAAAAGRRLLHVSQANDVAEERRIDDFTTSLDRESEMLLREKLLPKRSDAETIAFIGEETERTDEQHVSIESGKFYWIVDPLDGTVNAIAGRPEVAVSIALYRGEEPQFGVIDLPVRGMTMRRGGTRAFEVNGLLWEPRRTFATRLSEAIVALPGDLRKLRGTFVKSLIQQVLNEAAFIRITGTLAYDLASLALGEIDARISTAPKLVDVAAGIHLIEGIGGVVSDWNGRPWKLGAKFLAAGTKELHAELVSLCRGIS